MMTQPLIIDNFAGGGGASTGIEAAIGRSVDIAINHDPEAIAMHKANHPNTRHFCQSIMSIDPLDATQGKPVDLVWFSPDCTHFSKARGGKPVSANIRDLAMIVPHWPERLGKNKPRVIILENVEEFETWGPLGDDNRPCKNRKGQTFNQWVNRLRKLGYKVEWRVLRACDYGAPTTRKRLFLIARCDGQPIIWPKPTHGPDAPHDHRTAAEIIDWSIPCPSIFERKRPLKDATCRRIATGIMRYVINCAEPFIVPVTHTHGGNTAQPANQPLRTITTAKGGEFAIATPSFVPLTHHGSPERVYGPQQPLPTVTGANRGEIGLVAPTLVQTGYGEREGQSPRVPGLQKPLGTIVAGGGKHALVAAFMAQHNTGVVGHDARKPLSTLTQRGTQQNVVSAGLVKLRGTGTANPATEPLHTISAQGTHFAEIRAFLIKYYGNENGGHGLDSPLGTTTTKDRFGLVTTTIGGTEYAIADIGMRMLAAHELYAAQGFPAEYIINCEGPNGKTLTKTAQVRMCGNSVCPPLPEALVRANLPELCAERKAA